MATNYTWMSLHHHCRSQPIRQRCNFAISTRLLHDKRYTLDKSHHLLSQIRVRIWQFALLYVTLLAVYAPSHGYDRTAFFEILSITTDEGEHLIGSDSKCVFDATINCRSRNSHTTKGNTVLLSWCKTLGTTDL